MISEAVFEKRELRAIVCHDSDAGSRYTDTEEGLDELDTDGSFGRVDDAVAFCFFAGEWEKRVGVDEGDFGVWVEQLADPTTT
jgi:hypothetical protein